MIADPKVVSGGEAIDASVIDADLLCSPHEIDAIEANVATGYHAIEFLLWGQDLNGTDRRAVLAGRAGSLLVGLSFRAADARGGPGPFYVGCRTEDVERHFATGFHGNGTIVFDLALPGRGHGAAFRPEPAHCVLFARHPGSFAVVVDLERGEAVARIDAAAGRRFCGHGTFAADGCHLFTTETDLKSGHGVIGVRDADDGYRQVGEFATGGIGPHEVILMPDGATLVAANGGILTHPDDPGAKLNLDTMRPSLAYLDLASGRPLDRFELASRLSPVRSGGSHPWRVRRTSSGC